MLQLNLPDFDLNIVVKTLMEHLNLKGDLKILNIS